MNKAILAILALAALLAGCRPAPDARPRIGVAMSGFDGAFQSGLRMAVETAASGKAELAIHDGQDQQRAQDTQVATLLADKVKALAVNAVDRAAAGALIEIAKAARVPIVFFHGEPKPEDLRRWDKVYCVGSRPEQSGALQGLLLALWWKAHPAADRNKDGIIQLVALTGDPRRPESGLRAESAAKALEDAGIRVQALAAESARGERGRARDAMAALVARFGGRIEAVLCDDDESALGAIEALTARGWFSGGRVIPLVGAGATQAGLDAVERGSLVGTVCEDAARQGKAAFDLAYALARGQDAAKAGWAITDGKYAWIPWLAATADNLKTFRN